MGLKAIPRIIRDECCNGKGTLRRCKARREGASGWCAVPVAPDGLHEERRQSAVGPPQLHQHALADLGCCAVRHHKRLPWAVRMHACVLCLKEMVHKFGRTECLTWGACRT